MVKDALTDRPLPEDFPARIGRIVRAEGPSSRRASSPRDHRSRSARCWPRTKGAARRPSRWCSTCWIPQAFDTVVVLSAAVAATKIWPAIDPLASRSRWLDAAGVGERPASIAERVRRCLTDADALDGRPGSFVPRDQALDACAVILDGVHDAVPESAFYFASGIDEVLARPRS